MEQMGSAGAVRAAESRHRQRTVEIILQQGGPVMFALVFLLAYPYFLKYCMLPQIVDVPVKVLCCIDVTLNSSRKTSWSEGTANVCIVPCRKDKTPEFADSDHSSMIKMEDKSVGAGIHTREAGKGLRSSVC